MLTQQEEWRKSFENKTELELDTMEPPPGLTKDMAERWGYERAEALVRSLTTRAEAEDAQITQEKSVLESALTALENDTPEVQAAPQGMAPPPLLEIPRGNVADLLEQQIATCAALIGNVANFVAHSETPPQECFPMMDRIASLLSSSATAARVVGQLRGIANETRQTFVTENGGRRRGGVRQT
jgi:hypothetical protein